MLEQGEKLKAIRFVMQQTGVSLSEAKKYVEAPHGPDQRVTRVVYPPEPCHVAGAVEEKVCSLLVRDEKIQAIAYLREQTGMSLIEAQRYVEGLAPQVLCQKKLLQPQAPAKKKRKNFFTVVSAWSPIQKALLLLAISVLLSLFMYLMICLDKLL